MNTPLNTPAPPTDLASLPVTALKRVGPRVAELLMKLGIRTVQTVLGQVSHSRRGA